MNPVLHIHGQSCWHMPVLMIGNREALTRLRDAIDKALKWGKPQTVATMAADGEGYTVEVRLREADIWAPPWNNARLPYFDDIARDTRSEP